MKNPMGEWPENVELILEMPQKKKTQNFFISHFIYFDTKFKK